MTELESQATRVEPTASGAMLRWIRAVAIALVVIGCALRFVGLSSKVVWNDETHTGAVIAGTNTPEIRTELMSGQVVTRKDVLAYQFPRDDRSLRDTVASLYWDQPKHPPLYFVLARTWVKLFGSSVGVLRALSALLSLLGLPLVYLLCRELADVELFAWVAVGLFSISPLHLVYAQEARQYALWVDLVLLASWILLRAMRLTRDGNDRGLLWFAGYSVALALAMYSQLLTFFVATAHVVFILGAERFRASAVVRRAAASVALAALLFSPWALVVFLRSSDFSDWASWASNSLPVTTWLAKILYGASKVFVDMNRFHEGSPYVFSLVAGSALLIAALCALQGLRSAPRQLRWFVLTLAVAYWAPFVVSDVFRQSWRATVIRYQFPSLLGLQLCVAFGLACLLASRKLGVRRLAIAAAAALVACGVISGTFHSRASVWWNKFGGSRIQAVARIANDSTEPLIVTVFAKTGPGNAIALAHAVEDHVELQYFSKPKLVRLPEDRQELYLWGVDPARIGNQIGTDRVAQALGPRRLYRLTRN